MIAIDIDVAAAEPFPVRCSEGEFWLNLSAVRRLTATSDGRCCVHWRAGGAMMLDQNIETLYGAVWRENVAQWRRDASRDLLTHDEARRRGGEIRMRA